MKKIVILILIIAISVMAKDPSKQFIHLIDRLENCELAKDSTFTDTLYDDDSALYVGLRDKRNLYFGCGEDTVEINIGKGLYSKIEGMSINTNEYYKGIKVKVYRFFITDGIDSHGDPYKGCYSEVYLDEFGIEVHIVDEELPKSFDGRKIYTYFSQKLCKMKLSMFNGQIIPMIDKVLG